MTQQEIEQVECEVIRLISATRSGLPSLDDLAAQVHAFGVYLIMSSFQKFDDAMREPE